MPDSLLQRSGLRRGLAAAAAAALMAVPAVVGAQDPAERPYALPPGPEAEEAPRPEKPTPSLRRRAVIVPVDGIVRWAPPRRPTRRLLEATEAPLGSTIDARRGRVRVIVSRGGGRRWRAEFYDGRFRVEQSDRGRELLTSLVLIGGSFKDTCRPAANPDEVTAETARRRNRRVRRLWGDGKGRFRTRGRYSAATVRGTKWLVVDRCEDTLTRVARGEVEVEDFTLPGTPPEGGGTEDGSQQPAASPMRGSGPVRLRRGGSYSARPRG